MPPKVGDLIAELRRADSEIAAAKVAIGTSFTRT
jgi:hypothetical protein